MKSIKKLIAILLVATLSYPNLVVQGDSLGNRRENINIEQEIPEESSSEGQVSDFNSGTNGKVDGQESQEKAETEESSIDKNTDLKIETEVIKEVEAHIDAEAENTLSQENLEQNTETTKEEDINSTDKARIGKVYSKIKVADVVPQTYSIYEGEEELEPEVIEKREALLEHELLVTMTDAEYEIALSHADGTYTYMESCDTIEEAMEIVEDLRDDYDNTTVIPAAISKSGQVVYSTNSMGRMYQHRNGVPQPNGVGNSLLYTNSDLTGCYGSSNAYINMNYVDDVALIEDNGKAAKIRVNGFDGWINRDVDSGNYELVVIPVNQVTNPSNYYVSGGFLYHYITTNMIGSEGWGGTHLKIGLAPSFLKEGVKYLSYDGNYFYTGTTFADGLNKLLNDLKTGSTNNAVNPNNPHYNYFQYLPFRTKTSYTAQELDKYINENTPADSLLRGLGKTLKECEEKYGVNALISLSVAMNESDKGTSSLAKKTNNLYGMGAFDSNPDLAHVFDTPGDSAIGFARDFISKGYADPADWRYYGGYVGNKAFGANVKYASDPFWGEKATKYAILIDYTLSGNNINKLRDNNGYQLAKFTGTSEVRNASGTLLYNIAPSVVLNGKGGFKENIVALKFTEGTSSGNYQIFSERNTSIGNGGSANKYHGNYNWNDSGYVKTSSLQFINTPKSCFIPGYEKEDTTKNGTVGSEDLSDTAASYNAQKGSSSYRGYKDLNEDGIIDLYDLVNISKKLK